VQVLGIGGGSCVSCVQNSKRTTFFSIYFMLHPHPPLCFFSKVVNVQHFYFLLRVAPHLFLYVFCVHSSKHTMLVFNVTCCTRPHSPHPPLCFLNPKLQMCKVFLCVCVTHAPPSSMFFVSKVPSTWHVIFLLCVAPTPFPLCFFVSKPPNV
jgi:hypothetical protein